MESFKCPLCCNESFPDRESLKLHIVTTLNNIPCPVCEQTFDQISDFVQHLEDNCFEARDVKETYYCQGCDVNFEDFGAHLKGFHEGEEIILEEEDETVEEKILDKEGRLYTRKLVKADKEFLKNINLTPKFIQISKCNVCNVLHSVHDKSHDNCIKTEFSCDICNTSLNSFKSLTLHKRMHKIPEEDLIVVQDEFNCTTCNKKFHTQINLEMHLKAHSNNKKFICASCKKSFVTFEALNAHSLSDDTCQKRPYACQYCGRRFTRPHEKVKHERIHTGEKPHVCKICHKAFRVSYCLTLHMRTHSGHRPYECGTCGKKFKAHSVYDHHLKTHSDVRPYQCPFCPKAFKTSVQLAGHKNCHIKPFSCTECNRPFASLYAVRAHMETHLKENNLKFECWICGARYSRAFALRDHLRQQHQQESENRVEEEVLGLEEAPTISVD